MALNEGLAELLAKSNEAFDVYVRQLGLGDEEKVGAVIDHLSGVAKEEILCAPMGERNTYANIASLLQSRFGPLESVSSLTSALYARVQLEGESIADYSRALMRLHDRMEQACGEQERAALRLLRDGVLKEQFVKRTRDISVRREF